MIQSSVPAFSKFRAIESARLAPEDGLEVARRRLNRAALDRVKTSFVSAVTIPECPGR